MFFFFVSIIILKVYRTKEKLQKRTPESGIDRPTFINLLVDEFYSTTNTEAQEQVTANLANFAYDPLNYEFLKQSGAVNLYLELLDHVNPKLVEHGVAGLCNICLDPEVRAQIEAHEQIFIKLLISEDSSDNIKANILTIFIYIPAFKNSRNSRVAVEKVTPTPILKNLIEIFREK